MPSAVRGKVLGGAPVCAIKIVKNNTNRIVWQFEHEHRSGSSGLHGYLIFLFENGMRVWCVILISALVIHALCWGSCASQTLTAQRQAADPPCHEHNSKNPVSPQAPHESNRPCNQGGVLEAKAGIATKLFFVEMAPPVVEIRVLPNFAVLSEEIVAQSPPGRPSVFLPVSVLRI